jgi:hypothetical protein
MTSFYERTKQVRWRAAGAHFIQIKYKFGLLKEGDRWWWQSG